jgi:hypothetical protein
MRGGLPRLINLGKPRRFTTSIGSLNNRVAFQLRGF